MINNIDSDHPNYTAHLRRYQADDLAELLDTKGFEVEGKDNQYWALCPIHDDHNPNNFNFSDGDKGVRLHCFACEAQGISQADYIEQFCQKLGISPAQLFYSSQPETKQETRKEERKKSDFSKLTATYDYWDPNGTLRYQIRRYVAANGEKTFRARHMDPQGHWVPNIKGIEHIPYRLPEVLQAIKAGKMVLIPEGEKDVDRLRKQGFIATCNPFGAGKWRDEYSEYLQGVQGIILPDNDEPGRQHAHQVALSLHGKAAGIKIVELPGLAEKGDVSDWFEAGGDRAELERIIANTPTWHPSSKAKDETLATLLKAELPDIRYAIPGLLPEGCTLFGGKKGSGKSMFALHIAISVATGGLALGRYPTQAGDVLYYDLEGNRRRLQKRAKKMLASITDQEPIRLTIRYEAPHIKDGLLEEIKMWLADYPEARLVIIDLLARVRSSTGRNQQDTYQADYETLVGFQKLAIEREVSILVVHHTRKLAADDPFDELSGTTGLLGAADTGMVLRRTRGSKEALLHVTGRDLEDELEIPLTFDPATATWHATDEVAAPALSKERQEVLDLLKTHPNGLTPSEATPLLEKKSGAVKQMLRRMAEDGLIENDGSGRYYAKDAKEDMDNTELSSMSNRCNRVTDEANSIENQILETVTPNVTDISTDVTGNRDDLLMDIQSDLAPDTHTHVG